MAITNFIPTIWSENLLKQLSEQYIAANHCNRDYDGDIQKLGSVVKICGVGSVSVDSYTKNTDMSTPQTLSDTVTELIIDQAKYFNFQIDDIDRAQCTPKLMDAAMSIAANSLAKVADKYIFSLYEKASKTLTVSDMNPETLVNTIIKARQKLYEHGVTDSNDIVVEVSPAVATMILKAKIEMSFDNTDALEKGYVGNIAGCKIFVSNNIHATEGNGASATHNCMVRSKRSIAFAEQLSEIEAYRPEKRFADAVKGLHLYGAAVIYPDEIVGIDVAVDNEA